MIQRILICGLLAGLLAGALGTAFSSIVGEPAVDSAIAFEEASSAKTTSEAGAKPEVAAASPAAKAETHEHSSGTAGHDHAAASSSAASGHSHGGAEEELVSRSTQKNFGLFTATAVFGVAIGGLFALAFAVLYGRVGDLSPQKTVLWLAAAAFIVVFLVPFLKYPANPPAVGDPNTIGQRTASYLAMIAISIGLAISATQLRKALLAKFSKGVALAAAIASYSLLVLVAALLLPGSGVEIPKNFPAATLWEFRQATVGLQLLIWTVIGGVFALLVPRAIAGESLLPSFKKRDPSPRVESIASSGSA